jgi:putative copper export protein
MRKPSPKTKSADLSSSKSTFMNWLDWFMTVARFVSLTGAILLAGIFGFHLLMNGSDRGIVRLEFAAGRWILFLELMAFVGQTAWLGGLFWSLGPDVGSDGFDECQAFFFETQVGKIGLVRCGILLLLVTYRVLRSSGWRTKMVTWVEPVLAFVQLALLSWLSHAAAVIGPWGWIQVGTDLLHLTSTAIWPAGLIPLWLLLKPAAPEAIKQDILIRFSNVSLVVAPLVGATGILSAYFRLHAFTPLTSTPYGRYVLLKAACFFVLIGLGAAKRFRLIPGLRRCSEGPLLAENWQRLRKNILIEQALLIVVLFAVARLGLLPPPQ